MRGGTAARLGPDPPSLPTGDHREVRARLCAPSPQWGKVLPWSPGKAKITGKPPLSEQAGLAAREGDGRKRCTAPSRSWVQGQSLARPPTECSAEANAFLHLPQSAFTAGSPGTNSAPFIKGPPLKVPVLPPSLPRRPGLHVPPKPPERCTLRPAGHWHVSKGAPSSPAH